MYLLAFSLARRPQHTIRYLPLNLISFNDYKGVHGKIDATNVNTEFPTPLPPPKRQYPWSFTSKPNSSHLIANENPKNLSTLSYRSEPGYRVVYTKLLEEANDVVDCLKGNVLGFDMEWRPIFKRGVPPSKTALVQVCDHRTIALLQICHMKEFPEKLRAILENRTIIKTGLNIRGDALKLHRDYGVTINGLAEIGNQVQHVTHELKSSRMPSLQKCVEVLLDRHLKKGKVRISNWEQPLKPNQIEYAATDVYASYSLYHRIEALRHKLQVPDPMKLLHMADNLPVPETKEKKAEMKKGTRTAAWMAAARTAAARTATARTEVSVEEDDPRALELSFKMDDIMEFGGTSTRVILSIPKEPSPVLKKPTDKQTPSITEAASPVPKKPTDKQTPSSTEAASPVPKKPKNKRTPSSPASTKAVSAVQKKRARSPSPASSTQAVSPVPKKPSDKLAPSPQAASPVLRNPSDNRAPSPSLQTASPIPKKPSETRTLSPLPSAKAALPTNRSAVSRKDPFVASPINPFATSPTDPFATSPRDPFAASPRDPFVASPSHHKGPVKTTLYMTITTRRNTRAAQGLQHMTPQGSVEHDDCGAMSDARESIELNL